MPLKANAPRGPPRAASAEMQAWLTLALRQSIVTKFRGLSAAQSSLAAVGRLHYGILANGGLSAA